MVWQKMAPYHGQDCGITVQRYLCQQSPVHCLRLLEQGEALALLVGRLAFMWGLFGVAPGTFGL